MTDKERILQMVKDIEANQKQISLLFELLEQVAKTTEQSFEDLRQGTADQS